MWMEAINIEEERVAVVVLQKQPPTHWILHKKQLLKATSLYDCIH